MEKNNLKIGIVQGRLSPSFGDRFQFFPKDWEREFFLAKNLGFNSIEWLFDWPEAVENSIIRVVGRKEIEKVVAETGVKVNSICADYYMKYRFTGSDTNNSLKVLSQLIEAAKITTERLILIPLLEQNAPKTNEEKDEIILNIKKVLPEAEKNGVRITFETEMNSPEILEFLKGFHSDAVGVYYDIGNATSYGFNCPEDIIKLGKYIFGIHAKDRKVNTTQSVLLGQGDADYKGCFDALKKVGFSGTIIMQAWRGEDYLGDAKKQLLFLKEISKDYS